MKNVFFVLIATTTLLACVSNNEKQKPNQVPNPVKKTFEYQPEKPQNGVLMAAIEIGSLGLNYFIVSMDKEDRWELVGTEYGRSNLIFDDKNANQLLDEILAFKKEIESKGVKEENIHLIASSSAIGLSNMTFLKQELVKEGLELVPISANLEANYDLQATIPKEFANESFLVDIGSGNTKFSWVSEGDTSTLETFGSKYYLTNTPDSLVFRKIREIILDIPLKNRGLCFMIGGMPYEFANFTNKRQGRYTLLQSPNTYPKNGDKWVSGGVIYRAIYLEPTYSYIFDWDSNFSIGYLMSVN